MNKRIKKKRTKQARTIINKENRLNRRITNRANRANQRAMRKLSHGIGTSSIEANVTKLFKGIGQAAKERNEKEQIKQLKKERMAFLSEKLSSLEARYDKKGNLTDNQWDQYERYAKELEYLIHDGAGKEVLIAAAKDRYEKEHENLLTIKERLTNGEINQAIRYLHDKGIIKGQYDYYEDFLEQHQNEWSKDEVSELLEQHEAAEKEALEDALDILQNGTTYTPVKRRSKGYNIDFI